MLGPFPNRLGWPQILLLRTADLASRLGERHTAQFAEMSHLHIPYRVRTTYGTFADMEMTIRALGDESRRSVLETLRQGPATAGELASILPIARPGVSRHLRVLREAALVEVRKEAQRRVYSLRLEPLAELDAWLSPYRALWKSRLSALHTEIARGTDSREDSQ